MAEFKKMGEYKIYSEHLTERDNLLDLCYIRRWYLNVSRCLRVWFGSIGTNTGNYLDTPINLRDLKKKKREVDFHT